MGITATVIVVPTLWADFIYPYWKSAYEHWSMNRQISEFESAIVIIPAYSCDWVTAGNIFNELNDESKDGEVDLHRFGFTVSEAWYGEEIYLMPDGASSMLVATQYGSVTLFKDGLVVYISTQQRNLNGNDESIALTLRNENGVEITREITIDMREQTVTANAFADYGNQVGEMTQADGLEYYKSSLNELAITLGWTESDRIVGIDGSNTILTWTGDDYIIGGDQSDFLSGEQGNNTLVGRLGGDVFSLHGDKVLDDIFDVIKDFTPGDGDVIHLSSIIGERVSPLNYMHYLKLEYGADYASLLVDQDGDATSTTWSEVARLEYHSEFQVSQYSLLELIERGQITSSSHVPNVFRTPDGNLASI
ncbi:MAG: calcium-binding protein [Rhizobiales bacterium]|nr:calcium-binding protein [Hyphomicrobiales bacterium]MBO6699062.1 calcium-binding protein [Hyphomicrobiales bacterium]MBO6736600.1 calcium-binding protein [Hyphomicrobiales bacterium]MBO6912326.1 calcium-binding protein [Hyphomicrobiales bacterium]MBO6956311.1 calcium-binding protein [Hyphomicrobiales bacterium]